MILNKAVDMKGSDKGGLVKGYHISITEEDLDKEVILFSGRHNGEQPRCPFSERLGVPAAGSASGTGISHQTLQGLPKLWTAASTGQSISNN